ncbi:VOC family protein [Kineococcus sp. LSe6-4]|uniref:VOC family protein n=1 Tax=Kineococcus halophytocola TaxID=3234027 RepID=A0ABV4GZN1_9ACTN
MTTSPGGAPAARPTGIHHVRLTVTDIARSKAFYQDVFGLEPAVDFSAEAADPGVREDRERFYGGCVFALGDQLLGLRPVAGAGDRFVSTRVGLDHLSLRVGSRADLQDAADRLSARGIEHGEVLDLDQGLAVLSLQDPDDVNLELTAVL